MISDEDAPFIGCAAFIALAVIAVVIGLSMRENDARVAFWNTAPCSEFGNYTITNMPARCVEYWQGER